MIASSFQFMMQFLMPVFPILISIGAANLSAQTAEQIKFWKPVVAEKSFGEIADLVAVGSNPSWPKAESRHAIQRLTPPEKDIATEASSLVESLRRKVAAEIREDANVSLAEVERYAVAADVLERSGGYNNMVLADGLRRAAIFYLSGLLVRGSVPLHEVQAQAERLTVPRVDVRSLVDRLASEDDTLASHRAQFERIKPEQNLFAAFAALDIEDPFGLSVSTPAGLLNQPSGVALIMRLAGTELLSRVSLRGFFEFLKKGGTVQEIDPADIRAFQARMGGTERSYQYQLLSVRYLSVSHVGYLFEIHQSPAARRAFLRTALE